MTKETDYSIYVSWKQLITLATTATVVLLAGIFTIFTYIINQHTDNLRRDIMRNETNISRLEDKIDRATDRIISSLPPAQD